MSKIVKAGWFVLAVAVLAALVAAFMVPNLNGLVDPTRTPVDAGTVGRGAIGGLVVVLGVLVLVGTRRAR